VLRSLLWPGLTFYHAPRTKNYGYIYVGTGEKNLDLPFMLSAGRPWGVQSLSSIFIKAVNLVGLFCAASLPPPPPSGVQAEERPSSK